MLSIRGNETSTYFDSDILSDTIFEVQFAAVDFTEFALSKTVQEDDGVAGDEAQLGAATNTSRT